MKRDFPSEDPDERALKLLGKIFPSRESFAEMHNIIFTMPEEEYRQIMLSDSDTAEETLELISAHRINCQACNEKLTKIDEELAPDEDEQG